MKLAIIGARSLKIENLSDYISKNVTEIVSGGAKGVDSDAARYAKEHGIPLVEFLPDYARYSRAAPLKRNQEIASYADEALAFWDGASKGTLYTIELFKKLGKKVTIIKIPPCNGGYFSFGHSPNNTGCAQVHFLLACQPCNYYVHPAQAGLN